MADFSLTLAVIAVFCCVLFGWGRGVRWMITGKTDDGARNSWALTLILGLALLIALGGALNLVRLANVWGLSALAAMGLALCVAPWMRAVIIGLPRTGHTIPPRWEIAGRALMTVIALLVLVFRVATQLPPAARLSEKNVEPAAAMWRP